MNTSTLMRIAGRAEVSTHIGVVLLAACAVLAPGCSVTAPHEDPPPPGGGSSYVLDYDVFVSDIDPILTARGCDDLSCHGGGIRGTFQLSPDNDKNVDLDFSQACLQVDGASPADSPLLRKPLAEGAGGAAHAATTPDATFDSVDDPDYQAILAWIEAGAFQ